MLLSYVNVYHIHSGLPRCVEKFDRLAEKLFKASKSTQIDEVIREAEVLLKETANEKDKFAGDVYVKIMKKMKEHGHDFVENELNRVNKLLKDRITEKKRELFKLRLDVLRSFQHFILREKDEL